MNIYEQTGKPQKTQNNNKQNTHTHTRTNNIHVCKQKSKHTKSKFTSTAKQIDKQTKQTLSINNQYTQTARNTINTFIQTKSMHLN